MTTRYDLMLDLETLGRRAGHVVWEIGATLFHPETGEEVAAFHRLIDVPSAVEAGLTIEVETALWWEERGGIRRTGAHNLYDVARDFAAEVTKWEPRHVWCKGASFDFPLLEAMLTAVGVKLPWLYWQQRCCQTAWSLAFGEARRATQADHGALEDCRIQVRDLIAATQEIQGRKGVGE